MEQTRHFVSTVIIVHDDEVALHDHKRLPYLLPPGGHIDAKELPHEAAIRECKEETGITPQLIDCGDSSGELVDESVPEPKRVQVETIYDYEDGPTHRHINFIFFGSVDSKNIEPGNHEVSKDDWEWFSKDELEENANIPDDVARVSIDAIDVVEEHNKQSVAV